MCDYAELVKELRYCGDRNNLDCKGCSRKPTPICDDELKSDAADAIEELKFENEILNDGIDDLKAEVKRLEEVRDKALKRLCDWCGFCPEEKRDPLDCDDIAMLWEAREDEE